MDRRTFVGALAGGLLITRSVANAQPTGNVRRIGYLGSTIASYLDAAFRQGLQELGWVQGRNIVVDYRFAKGKFDRLPGLANELIGLKAEVIVAGPTPPALAAKNATRTIPVVMWGVNDPVEVGLVASLARSGGNVTGVSYSVGSEVFGKQLQLLKEALPKIQRVAILSNTANPATAPAVSNVRAAARSLGVSLQVLEARAPDEFEAPFAAMAKERAEALLVVQDSMFAMHGARLADFAVKHRLPSMYGLRWNVEAGSLMSYGPTLAYQLRQAAVYVDKILRGAKPADLPVEQPTKFELVINLKTAKALGLTLQPSLLLQGGSGY